MAAGWARQAQREGSDLAPRTTEHLLRGSDIAVREPSLKLVAWLEAAAANLKRDVGLTV